MSLIEDTISHAGSVVSLWRYPVKSMGGEELQASAVNEHGLLGDRAYALVDRATGKVASGKHPGKWARLLECRAAFAVSPRRGQPLPPVLVTLPDNTVVSSNQPGADAILSRLFGRDVTLVPVAPPAATFEAYLTSADGQPDPSAIADAPVSPAAPAGTFFNFAAVHLLTTATLARLQDLYPSGRFDVRRFRPNIVVAPTAETVGFVENNWIGQSLAGGADLRMRLIDPCPRCVMTTLPLGGNARV